MVGTAKVDKENMRLGNKQWDNLLKEQEAIGEKD